jgi:hypothetical protein
MAFHANPEQHVEQQQPQVASKPTFDPSEYWTRPSDSSFSIKTGVTLPDSLTMTSPYGKSEGDVFHVTENEPRDKSLDELLHPKDSTDVKEPMTPRQAADKRDADAMMDAIRSGKLDDLKNLVSDMSPEKLKRVAEQMKAEGFEMTATKDGKFVLFNKDLGLGVSVEPGKDGEPAKASVVKKEADGNFVPSTDGLDPEKLLKNLSTQIPHSDKEIEDIVKELEKNFPKHDPWTRILFDTDAEAERKAHEDMLKRFQVPDR